MANRKFQEAMVDLIMRAGHVSSTPGGGLKSVVADIGRYVAALEERVAIVERQNADLLSAIEGMMVGRTY